MPSEPLSLIGLQLDPEQNRNPVFRHRRDKLLGQFTFITVVIYNLSLYLLMIQQLTAHILSCLAAPLSMGGQRDDYRPIRHVETKIKSNNCC